MPTILLTTVGSGPFGESTAESHIWTLQGALPEALQLSQQTASPANSPERMDFDIGPRGLAFVISDILSPEEADALAAVSEAIGYSRFAPAIRTPPGMRQNSAAHWVSSDAHGAELLDPMYARFSHLLPKAIAGGQLHGSLSRRMAHYKYGDGDVFNKHTDGEWPGQSIEYEETKQGGRITRHAAGISEWPGVVSRLSMLLYLNDADDGVEGGATRLFHTSGDGSYVDVAPKKGSALFFRHGFGSDSVMHMGTRVSGDVPKYVVRLNVLYDAE